MDVWADETGTHRARGGASFAVRAALALRIRTAGAPTAQDSTCMSAHLQAPLHARGSGNALDEGASRLLISVRGLGLREAAHN